MKIPSPFCASEPKRWPKRTTSKCHPHGRARTRRIAPLDQKGLRGKEHYNLSQLEDGVRRVWEELGLFRLSVLGSRAKAGDGIKYRVKGQKHRAERDEYIKLPFLLTCSTKKGFASPQGNANWQPSPSSGLNTVNFRSGEGKSLILINISRTYISKIRNKILIWSSFFFNKSLPKNHFTWPPPAPHGPFIS